MLFILVHSKSSGMVWRKLCCLPYFVVVLIFIMCVILMITLLVAFNEQLMNPVEHYDLSSELGGGSLSYSNESSSSMEEDMDSDEIEEFRLG